MTHVLVFVGAMAGAPLRYLTDRAVQTRYGGLFPWGTVTVNVVGCLILGAVTGLAVSDSVHALVATGFCGALTTYSTFGYETFRLVERRAYLTAAMNVAISLVAGLGAALLGFAAGSAMVR